jgi:hypothetical protein
MPPKNKKLDIPEGVPSGLWDMLLSIKADTAATSLRVDHLETRVDDLEESQDLSLAEKVAELTKTVDILASRLTKHEKVTENLTDQLDSIRAHSMKENLIFNFDAKIDEYKEVQGETTTEIVRAFLSNVLGIDARGMFIPVAHRIGSKRGNNRSVIAKFPVAKERELVMSKTNRLRDTGHYINKQLTAKQRERKRFVLPTFKDLKVKPDNEARLLDDKLFVKGKLQTKFLPPVIPPPTMHNPTLKLQKGGTISDSGSTFHGYAVRVRSIQDVSDALHIARSILELASANHLVYAYRFGDGDKCKQNFDSDGDHGIGLHMLEHMIDNTVNNTMLIVARHCTADFKHIGKRRMEHSVKACEKALSDLID